MEHITSEKEVEHTCTSTWQVSDVKLVKNSQALVTDVQKVSRIAS